MAVVAAQPTVFLRLMTNIDLGSPHTPFPVFAASLDGGGNTVTGLTTMDGANVGLVGTLTGSVSHLFLGRLTITGDMAGAVAARMSSGSIQDVTVLSVGGPSNVVGNNVAGGLVGEMTGGTITQAHVDADVTSPSVSVGGLVGVLQAGTIQKASFVGLAHSMGPTTPVGGAVGRTGLGTMNLAEIRMAGTVMGMTCTGGLVGVTQPPGSVSMVDIRMSGSVQQPVDPMVSVVTAAGLLGCAEGLGNSVNRALVTGEVSGPAPRKALWGGSFPEMVQATQTFYVGTAVTTMDAFGTNLTDADARLRATYSSSWDEMVWSFATGMYPELSRAP
jgi:hypothetical protein